MQKSGQELPPGRQHTGHLGLHLVSSPHPSLGLGTDKEEPAGLEGTLASVSCCRALSLVPRGISVPSTCPRPDQLWDEGLDYQSLPVPDKTLPANQDSLACLPDRSVSGCSAHIGRGGHIPEHYLIHLAEGISASATKQLSMSLIQRGPWPPTVPSRVSCCCPIGQCSMGSAHCPQNGGEGAPGPQEREEGEGAEL